VSDREAAQRWEANAPAWIELSRAGYDVYRDLVNTPAFLAMLPDVSTSSGLDLGCGEGHNTRLLRRRAGRVVGLDVSRTFVDAARAEEAADPLGIRYLQGSAHHLPLRSRSVDFVVGFMSLMDIPDPAAALAESHRVLRSGGFCQFSIVHPLTLTPVRKWVTDATAIEWPWPPVVTSRTGRSKRPGPSALPPRTSGPRSGRFGSATTAGRWRDG